MAGNVTPEQIRAVWLDPTLSRPAAATQVGLTVQALRHRARKLKLPMRDPIDTRASEVADERVREVWAMGGLSRKEQARMAGMALSALTWRAQQLKLPMRRTATEKRVPASRVRQLWLDPRLSGRQVADALGLTPSSLRRRVVALKLPHRKNGTRYAIIGGESETLFAEMWEARVRSADIAEHFAIHRMTVSAYARRMKLTKRRSPGPLISLDRFWQDRREGALRRAMEMVAFSDNGAILRQDRDDFATDPLLSELVIPKWTRRVVELVPRPSGWRQARGPTTPPSGQAIRRRSRPGSPPDGTRVRPQRPSTPHLVKSY